MHLQGFQPMHYVMGRAGLREHINLTIFTIIFVQNGGQLAFCGSTMESNGGFSGQFFCLVC